MHRTDLPNASFLRLVIMRSMLVMLFVAPVLAHAQYEFNNKGAAVYVQKNGYIKIQGKLTNANADSTATVQNDGTIELTGDFENQSGAKFKYADTSTSKERVVKFIGSGTQLIKGDMSTPGQSGFYNLVIDKASSSDTVEMQTGVAVAGSLVFGTANSTSSYNPSDLHTNNNTKGLLKTYSSTTGEQLLDIQNGSSDAVSGYAVLEMGGNPSTGFILTSGTRGSSLGGLQRKIASATSYVFPIGTANKGYNAVKLNFASVPGNGSVKAKFCEGSSNASGRVGMLSSYCYGCTGNSSQPDNGGYNRYFPSNDCNGGAPQWIIFENTAKDHGYWSFASTNQGYHYDMEVFPNSYGAQANPTSTWRVLKHESIYGDDPSVATVDWRPEIDELVSNPNDLLTYTKNAGCYTGNGVPGGMYTDFSHFTLGTTGANNALPVQLLYLKAEPGGRHHIRVTWATAIEINNAGFEVMRSTDGVNFTDVGWVAGHNNSTVNENYTFDDRTPVSNVLYYYKLRQVDNNQKFVYSYVVEAKLDEMQSSEFTLYPNPTHNDLFLNVKNPSDEIKVTMYDIKGAEVYSNIFPVEANGQEQTVTVRASYVLPGGTYILNATTNGMQYSAKVVLQ